MPRLSLGLGISSSSKQPSAPSAPFSPINITGLSLWLKADTGVTAGGISQIIISGFTGIYTGANGTYNYDSEQDWWFHNSASYYIGSNGNLYDDNDQTVIATNNNNFQGAWSAGNYFSTITLSNAGDSQADGVYTRSDSGEPFASFTASGGRYISYDDNEGFWFTDGDLYRNNNDNLAVNGWDLQNGEEPIPTAVNSNSVRNVGSPTSTTVAANLVTAWADQSGNSRNFTKSIDNTGFPTFSNGALLFTTNDTYGDTTASILALPSESLNLTGPYTLITLVRAGANNSCVFSKSNDGNKRRKYQLYVNGGVIGSLESTNNEDTGISYDTGTGDDVNIKRIIVSQFTSDSSGLIRYNGAEVQVGTGDDNGYGLNETNSASVFIGASPFDEGNGYNAEASTEMYVYEIIFYNRAITTSEIQQVEAYLMDKYDIQA